MTTDSSDLPQVSAHVLGEHVFCPRAAILARESGDDSGDEEPLLGPRLATFHDFNEQMFARLLDAAWGRMRLFLTLMAPGVIVPLVVVRLGWPVIGIGLSLPAFYLGARLWETWKSIQHIVQEMKIVEGVELESFDASSSEMRQINWWALRKAGYDCELPREPYFNSEQQLAGKPWRVLTNGALRIPVVRMHPRETRVWPKHIVRLAAYCRLIETCEGASAPFGVLIRGGSYDCVIVPRTPHSVEQFERALDQVRDFLRVNDEGEYIPAPPRDNRCSGCHWGEPHKYPDDRALFDPQPVRGNDGQLYHSTCGNYFEWVPPHNYAVKVGIAQRR